MFGWPVLLAWLIAVVLAIGIMAFACYEVAWRLRKLRTHAERLDAMMVELREVAAEAQQTRDRAERVLDAQAAAREEFAAARDGLRDPYRAPYRAPSADGQ